MLRSQANHAHPVVDPAPSSSTMVAVAAAAVLVGQARGRRSGKRGRRRVVGAWRREKQEGKEREDRLLASVSS